MARHGGIMRSRTASARPSIRKIVLAGLSFLLLATAPRTVVYAGDVQAGDPHAVDASALAWVKTGGPLGGIGYDIRARSDNPDVMLVTDNARGMHISIDDGLTWSESNTGIDIRIGDGYPIFSLTIDPPDNDIVWAGTQSRMGIFKSTDMPAAV